MRKEKVAIKREQKQVYLVLPSESNFTKCEALSKVFSSSESNFTNCEASNNFSIHRLVD